MTMKPITHDLVQAALQGRLDDAFKASSGDLTADVAEDARQAFLEAADARDGATAMATALIASRIYERLGDRHNQLLNLVDFLQVQFMVASTAQQYDMVRKGALAVVRQADAAALPQFGFAGAVIAADSAFFAAQSMNNDRAWMKTSLADVVAAFDRAAGHEKDGNFLKLVDLAATVVNNVMTWVLFDQAEQERRGLLQRVAAQVDQLVPADFEWPGNPQQTSKIAAILAQLSDNYGVHS